MCLTHDVICATITTSGDDSYMYTMSVTPCITHDEGIDSLYVHLSKFLLC